MNKRMVRIAVMKCYKCHRLHLIVGSKTLDDEGCRCNATCITDKEYSIPRSKILAAIGRPSKRTSRTPDKRSRRT